MSIKPILVVPAISKDDRIKFILPDQEINLEQSITKNAWTILDLCNGLNSIEQIIEKLPEINQEFIVGFINDLTTLKVVSDSRELYKSFHAISRNPPTYSPEITPDEAIAHEKSPRLAVKEGKAFDISSKNDSALTRLQEQRWSCRNFTGEALSIEQIGKVLDAGYSYRRHAVPSAGSLYPLKLFAIALEDQQDIPAGYYEYDNEKEQLVLFNDRPDPEQIAYAFNDTGLLFGASVVIVIAADLSRQPYKYANRGYRFTAIEVGEVAQNIVLAAVENGLDSCIFGGFQDQILASELTFDEYMPFITIAIGKSSDEDRTDHAKTLAKLELALVGEDKPIHHTWLGNETMQDDFDRSYFQFLAVNANGQVTSGTSTSWQDAKTTAIAEGYERQRSSAVHFDIRAKARDLPGLWLDPRIVAPLTDEQYSKLPYLQKFTEDLEIEWIVGLDAQGRKVFVPIDLVFYPVPDHDRKLIVDTCSSGFATFSNYQEAAKRGLLELIERDSLMRSWFEHQSPRKISPESWPVHLQNRRDFWTKRGCDVYLLDLSRDGVIVVEAIVIANCYPRLVSGACASLESFGKAATKAFQEAESRLIYGLNNPSKRTITPEQVSDTLDNELLYAQSREYHGHVQFLLDGNTSTEVPHATTSVRTLQSKFEAVTVDVSEELSPLKVVRVISPNLIPISFGYRNAHFSHHTLNSVVSVYKTLPHYFA